MNTYVHDNGYWSGLSARGSRAGNAEVACECGASRWPEIPLRVNQKATLDLDFAPVLIEYHYPSLASNILGGVCAARTLDKRRAIISPIPVRHVEAVIISNCHLSIRLLALS